MSFDLFGFKIDLPARRLAERKMYDIKADEIISALKIKGKVESIQYHQETNSFWITVKEERGNLL